MHFGRSLECVSERSATAGGRSLVFRVGFLRRRRPVERRQRRLRPSFVVDVAAGGAGCGPGSFAGWLRGRVATRVAPFAWDHYRAVGFERDFSRALPGPRFEDCQAGGWCVLSRWSPADFDPLGRVRKPALSGLCRRNGSTDQILRHAHWRPYPFFLDWVVRVLLSPVAGFPATVCRAFGGLGLLGRCSCAIRSRAHRRVSDIELRNPGFGVDERPRESAVPVRLVFGKPSRRRAPRRTPRASDLAAVSLKAAWLATRSALALGGPLGCRPGWPAALRCHRRGDRSRVRERGTVVGRSRWLARCFPFGPSPAGACAWS